MKTGSAGARFLLLLVEGIELQELDPVVDDKGDNEKVDENTQEISPEDGDIPNVNARLFEAISGPEEYTQDWIDDIGHQSRHYLGNRTPQDKPDGEPDHALLPNKLHESFQCLHRYT